jgi:hypothetical protein
MKMEKAAEKCIGVHSLASISGDALILSNNDDRAACLKGIGPWNKK